LRHGELVTVTRPKLKHSLIQGKLRELLTKSAEPGSYVEIEVPFRPLSEYELWVAEVGYVSRERFEQADLDDNFHGAPDIVIEVLSPSNPSPRSTIKSSVAFRMAPGSFGWSTRSGGR
jgi:Uma2 family endonuclease